MPRGAPGQDEAARRARWPRALRARTGRAGTGVVRAMARSDHWRWVSTPGWRRTSANVTSTDQRRTKQRSTSRGSAAWSVQRNAVRQTPWFDADHDRSVRHEGGDQQAEQAARRSPARPAAAVQHAVVVGEARRPAQAHAAQRRGNGAPPRGQEGACDEHQQVGPGRAGEAPGERRHPDRNGGFGPGSEGAKVGSGVGLPCHGGLAVVPLPPDNSARARRINRAVQRPHAGAHRGVQPGARRRRRGAQGGARLLAHERAHRCAAGQAQADRGRRPGAGALVERPTLGRSRAVRHRNHAARRSSRLHRLRAALLDQRMASSTTSRSHRAGAPRRA